MHKKENGIDFEFKMKTTYLPLSFTHAMKLNDEMKLQRYHSYYGIKFFEMKLWRIDHALKQKMKINNSSS